MLKFLFYLVLDIVCLSVFFVLVYGVWGFFLGRPPFVDQNAGFIAILALWLQISPFRLALCSSLLQEKQKNHK